MKTPFISVFSQLVSANAEIFFRLLNSDLLEIICMHFLRFFAFEFSTRECRCMECILIAINHSFKAQKIVLQFENWISISIYALSKPILWRTSFIEAEVWGKIPTIQFHDDLYHFFSWKHGEFCIRIAILRRIKMS